MDITESDQAEEALRESQERFRHAFEGAPIGMALVGIDGRFLKVNCSLAEMLGCSEQELVATDFQAVTHSDDLDVGLNYMQQMLAGEIDSCQFEKRYLHKLGHEVWALLSFSLLRDPGGSPLYFISQIQDITERKRAEEALRESEHKFRLLAENVAEVFWLLDPETYQVLYVSPSYEELWGRTCESLCEDPRSWLIDIHPEDIERVSSALEKQAGTGEFDEEFRIIRSDGSIRWVWDRGFAVKDERGQVQHMVGVAADVTERKRAEEALQEARELLEGKVERQMRRRNPYRLTFRELTVLHLVGAGRSNKGIGLELGISPLTAHTHVSNILAKMRVASRTEAVARALREGLLD